MNLINALRLNKQNKNLVISIVGAGGKTTALFQLARQIQSQVKGRKSQVVVTTTTHLAPWQIKFADYHIVPKNIDDLKNMPADGIILITGDGNDKKVNAPNSETLIWLRAYCQEKNIPLLIEADGSRQRPIKSPAEHEPPIPEFSDFVIYVLGLSCIGKQLNNENVHRPEIFSQLTKLELNQNITPESIIKTLTHPQGGLKNIPSHSKRIVLLNQADTPELKSIGGDMAKKLLNHFDSVVVGSLQQDDFQTFEKTAGVILAAGDATRFGSPKQLLDWKGKPFVRHIAETALHADLQPVLVITGNHHAEIESCLQDLPVEVIHNPQYKNGQSESIKLGIKNLPDNIGANIFLLADQPQIPVEVIQALKEKHTQTLSPIIAPLILEERRANPVLFDKVTFDDLLQLTGDVGGRAIFDKHKVDYLPWHDDILIFDVDTKEDYARLKGLDV
ncbi:MAG: 4-diphosphocytidyl-2C-methyl-D-erythritol synthase [Chloroflexi bacterium OLB14]|nr:MAG: 4-diphosphocytidyl-2C-methyl-D-erythritol synthase [Chloroflexi bacterium OLB14]